MNKILLVEDVLDKAEKIKKCVNREFPEIVIEECTSYHSALKEIFENYDSYSLILLDMSMSTYDQNIEEFGGVPEAMAGKRILEGMFLREIPTKVIVVTMYESFMGEGIKQLDILFKTDYSDFYLGYVFFSFNKTDWKKQLIDQIRQVL